MDLNPAAMDMKAVLADLEKRLAAFDQQLRLYACKFLKVAPVKTKLPHQEQLPPSVSRGKGHGVKLHNVMLKESAFGFT